MPHCLQEILQALAYLPFAAGLRESQTLYLVCNAAHIAAIGLLFGSIVTLDLRTLGFFRDVPFTAIAGPTSQVALAGLLLALGTGFLLFSVRPLAYAANPAFLAKISLVVLGAANALWLRRQASWQNAPTSGRLAAVDRFQAALSLSLWAAAIVAGRWIGFLQ